MNIHKWCVKHNFGAPLSLGVPAMDCLCPFDFQISSTRFEKWMLKIFIIDSIIQIHHSSPSFCETLEKNIQFKRSIGFSSIYLQLFHDISRKAIQWKKYDRDILSFTFFSKMLFSRFYFGLHSADHRKIWTPKARVNTSEHKWERLLFIIMKLFNM